MSKIPKSEEENHSRIDVDYIFRRFVAQLQWFFELTEIWRASKVTLLTFKTIIYFNVT